ncbi:MAG: hypothetical protein GXO02_06050 [Epsilonproteobacteria bacterium]|nr:hypothetical protein [Campylobacterota bacterium]
MASDKRSGKFWPLMILTFLFIGITLAFWTVKNTKSMPVQESNSFMMKYQIADKYYNEIQEAEAIFNKSYNAKILDMNLSDFKPKHLKRKVSKIYALNKLNTIRYKVTTKDGKSVNDANVTLLVTRPHTRADDKYYFNPQVKDGIYTFKNVDLKDKYGRYILRVRIQKGKAIKFIDSEAYYKPKAK